MRYQGLRLGRGFGVQLTPEQGLAILIGQQCAGTVAHRHVKLDEPAMGRFIQPIMVYPTLGDLDTPCKFTAIQ